MLNFYPVCDEWTQRSRYQRTESALDGKTGRRFAYMAWCAYTAATMRRCSGRADEACMKQTAWSS